MPSSEDKTFENESFLRKLLVLAFTFGNADDSLGCRLHMVVPTSASTHATIMSPARLSPPMSAAAAVAIGGQPCLQRVTNAASPTHLQY
jgi:hypothetical protein